MSGDPLHRRRRLRQMPSVLLPHVLHRRAEYETGIAFAVDSGASHLAAPGGAGAGGSGGRLEPVCVWVKLLLLLLLNQMHLAPPQPAAAELGSFETENGCKLHRKF